MGWRLSQHYPAAACAPVVLQMHSDLLQTPPALICCLPLACHTAVPAGHQQQRGSRQRRLVATAAAVSLPESLQRHCSSAQRGCQPTDTRNDTRDDSTAPAYDADVAHLARV